MKSVIPFVTGLLPIAGLLGVIFVLLLDHTRLDFLHRAGYRYDAIVRRIYYTLLVLGLLAVMTVLGIVWWVKRHQLEAAQLLVRLLGDYIEATASAR